MSSGLAVRSLGRPYFAFVQKALSGMNGPGGGGEFGVEVVAKINVLPTASAAGGQAELHPLLSWCDFRPGGDTRLALGITPSGRLKGYALGNQTISSAPGLISADNEFHTLRVDYFTSGYFQLKFDAAIVATSSPAGGDIATGNIGQFMLFNDMKGVSRTDATIQDAFIYDENGLWEWPILERHGLTLQGTKHTDWPDIDTTLTADWWNPSIFPLLWGDVPATDPRSAYRFERVPNWNKRAERAMTWVKR